MQIKRSNVRTGWALSGEDKNIALATSAYCGRTLISLTAYYRGLQNKELGSLEHITDKSFVLDTIRNKAVLSSEFIKFLRDNENQENERDLRGLVSL
jgi:hypothetical protein